MGQGYMASRKTPAEALGGRVGMQGMGMVKETGDLFRDGSCAIPWLELDFSAIKNQGIIVL